MLGCHRHLVSDEETSSALHGLPKTSVRPGEVVRQHWSSPGGRGLVTNQRCILLSHPSPIHREMVWERNLEKIEHLEVVSLVDDPEVVAFVERSLAGCSKFGHDSGMGVVKCGFKVTVDDVSVYGGEADTCANVQRWIDDARTQRSIELFGRLIPYGA